MNERERKKERCTCARAHTHTHTHTHTSLGVRAQPLDALVHGLEFFVGAEKDAEIAVWGNGVGEIWVCPSLFGAAPGALCCCVLCITIVGVGVVVVVVVG